MKRASAEQRVWRAAFLLSGGSVRDAFRHLTAIGRRKPDMERLDRAHLDRLVVLATREHPRSHELRHPILSVQAQTLLDAAYGLDRQPFEAWVFSDADALELMEVSRAMDCSTTATDRHLEVARARLGEKFSGRYDELLAALRHDLSTLAPAPEIARARRVVARELRIRRWIVLLLLMFGALMALVWTI